MAWKTLFAAVFLQARPESRGYTAVLANTLLDCFSWWVSKRSVSEPLKFKALDLLDVGTEDSC